MATVTSGISIYKILDIEGKIIHVYGIITGVNVSDNICIEKINSLDISGMPGMLYVNCGNSNLTELNLSNNSSIIELNCAGTNLTKVDVTQFPTMTLLSILNMPKLNFLDISNNNKLSFNVNIKTNAVETIRTVTQFDKGYVSDNVVSLISYATSKTGTLEYVPGGVYEKKIVNAAKDKGWTVKQIAG